MNITRLALLVGLALNVAALSRSAIAATLEERTAERLDALEKENNALKQRLKVIESSVATPGHAASRQNAGVAPSRYGAPPPLSVGSETLGSADAALEARAQGGAQFYKNPVAAAPISHFELSGSLMYLQPGAGNLEYATLITPFPLPTPNWANQSLAPVLSPAFSLGLRYIPNESIDVRLDWAHLSSTTTALATATPTQMIGPSFQVGPDAFVFKRANGSAGFAYDSITMDAGHTFCADCQFQLRVFGGIEVARIGETVSATFLSPDVLTTAGNTTTSLFTGAGPRFGMKGDYVLGHFDLFGEAAVSGLIGTSQSRINFAATSPASIALGISPNLQSLTSPNMMQVIPSLQAKLGTAYSFPPANYGRLKIEVGYQAAIYMNAINQYALTQVATPPVAADIGIFLETAQHLQSSFSTQGPYMTANWLF